MNGFTGDTQIKVITPAWEIAVPVVMRVLLALFVWSAVGFGVVWIIEFVCKLIKDLDGGYFDNAK